MGRPRKNRKDLPQRVYVKHGAYYYVFPDGKWKRLADLGDERGMKLAWAVLEQPNEAAGTVAALIDQYLVEYAAVEKAPRTYKDNIKEAEYLKAYFGQMLPHHVQPRHIGSYLHENRTTRAVRANREKALLSHVFTWAMVHKDWGVSIQNNPCRGVKRNPESKRIRVVSDEEYLSVYGFANRNVQRLMTLIYRTLQRPSDLLSIGQKNIIKKIIEGEEVEILWVKQSKTGAIVEIILTDDLSDALYDFKNNGKQSTTSDSAFILNRHGKTYTLDGIDTNFRHALEKHRAKIKKLTGVMPESFGIYDLKGKGATDMYQDGVPLEKIQVLAAHDSIQTTEIYIKERYRHPVVSNTRQIKLSIEDKVLNK
jgi:site-specific recombinase XerD